MAWATLLLCIILGSFSALRPSGRKSEFKKIKAD